MLGTDDGLAIPSVGPWATQKYRLLDLYDQLFSTGMKNKWKNRIYIDLYAGSGLSRVQESATILKGSPLLALTVPNPFDKYIFCEKDSNLLSALRTRAGSLAPQANITYILGSCDDKIDQICNAIPKASRDNSVLSLCLVDPFDFGVKFATIRKLSDFYIDFVVLLAVGMDANRNYDHYVDGHLPKIDEALGNTIWRDRWVAPEIHKSRFRDFLAKEFAKSMESLGYLPQTLDQMRLVKSHEKNLPLYYLALFSKSQTAYQFWSQVMKYGVDQQTLF